MAENKFKGATVMYGPKNASQVFTDSNDVPKGWSDNPGDFTAEAGESEVVKETAPDAAALPMERADIVVALKAGNVQFKGNASTANLYAALVESLKAHLTATEVAFPADATAPEMLKLLDVNPQS